MPNSRSRPEARTRIRTAWCAGVVAGSAGLLGACTPAADAAADPRPLVLTTFTVLADMAQVVAGPDVRVESLTGVGTEIHGYEPTPDDLRRADGADLLLANGMGLEVWLEQLVAPLDLPTVVLTDAVEPLPIAGSTHANPHAWMSPATGRAYVAAIVEALTPLVPERAADIAARAEAYDAELAALHSELVARLDALEPGRRLLVTCEGAFSYLARDAGLDEAFLWPVNAERQGTPRQVAAVIRRVREADVTAVFCESTVSPTAQLQVARETGARFGGTLYVDSLSAPDGPVPTYLDLLRHDVDVLVEGLTGAPGEEAA